MTPERRAKAIAWVRRKLQVAGMWPSEFRDDLVALITELEEQPAAPQPTPPSDPPIYATERRVFLGRTIGAQMTDVGIRVDIEITVPTTPTGISMRDQWAVCRTGGVQARLPLTPASPVQKR